MANKACPKQRPLDVRYGKVSSSSLAGTPGTNGTDGTDGADGAPGTLSTTAVDYCSTDPALTLSGAPTVDGVVVTANKRVLWAPPLGHVNAGVYVSAAGAWSRAGDVDTAAEIDTQRIIQIKDGVANFGRLAVLDTAAPITLGATPLVYRVELATPSTTGTDAGKFAIATPSGNFSYYLPATGSIAFTVDAAGVLQVARADSINLLDYPYNASTSTTATTATGTAGSAAITLASGTSYLKRDAINLLGAGAAHTMPAPATPTASVAGTVGTLSRNYKAVARLEGEGMSIASPAVTVNAPDCLLDPVTAAGTALTGLLRVDWATTGNLTGYSGGTFPSVAGTQDDSHVRVGDDVLVKDQSTLAQNGVYKVLVDNLDGTYSMSRGASMDTAAEATRGRRVHVSSGTVNGGKYFRITSASVVTLGTDPIVFEEAYVRLRPYGALCDGVIKVNVANLAACPTAQPGYTIGTTGGAGPGGVYRQLLVGQTTTSQNGVYLVSGVGGGTCTLTRDTSFDTAAELPLGTYFRIGRGDDSRTSWVVTTAAATLGTNPLLFTQIQVYQWDWYGSTAAGAYDYLGAAIANPLLDSAPGSQVLYDSWFDDVGAGAVTRPRIIPSTPPVAARSNSLRARIVSINGTAVTLDTVLGTSVTAASFVHDNYLPITEAIAALPSGGKITLPLGTLLCYGNITEAKPIRWEGSGMAASIIKFGAGFGWETRAGSQHGSHQDFWLQAENSSVPCGGLYISHDVGRFHGAMALVRVRGGWDRVRFSDSTNIIRGSGYVNVGREVNGDNSNLTHAANCYADSCIGHGFLAYGSDTNQDVFFGCSSTSASGYGFYDASFLGLKFDSCHASNCLRGPYITEQDTAISKWDTCYSELGQGAAKIGSNTRVSGGDHGAGFINPYVGSLTQGSYQNPFIVTTGRPEIQIYIGDKNGQLVHRYYQSLALLGLDFRSGIENNDKIRWNYFNTQVTGGGFLTHGRHHEGNGNVEFQANLWVSSGYSAGSSGGSNRVKIASVSAAANVPSFPNALYKKGSSYRDSTAADNEFVITRNFGLTSTTWTINSTKIVGNLCKPTTPNGYVYAVTATSGATGGLSHATTEPTWPTTIGNTVVDNGLTWICYGYDAAVSTIDGLPNYRAVGARTVTATVTPGTINAGAVYETTQAVTDAAVGDDATATPQADVGAGLVWCAWVSSAGNIKLRIANPTGGNIAANAVSWRFTARH